MNLTECRVWDRIWQWMHAWSRPALVLVTLASFSVSGSSAFTADDPFDDLRQRVEQLEIENRELRSAVPAKLAPVAFEDEAVAFEPSGDEQEIGRIVEEYLNKRAETPNPVEVAQQQEISTLQHNLTGVMDKLNKKTLPTTTINGVFQADAVFTRQDANSFATYQPVEKPV